MDLATVDISNISPVPKVGDWVEVLGKGIGVDELAAWADTVGYDVLTRLGLRTAPLYLQ